VSETRGVLKHCQLSVCLFASSSSSFLRLRSDYSRKGPECAQAGEKIMAILVSAFSFRHDQRQYDNEFASLAQLTFYSDCAALQLDYFTAQRQAQSRPFVTA
jgi:hypothetical protein